MISEKKIIEKIKKIQPHWDHDIQYIDGKFVEDVVKEYQESGSEDLLMKIINNYALYKKLWGRAFAPYCDNDPEAGELMYNEIIWRSSTKFNMEKCLKPKGKAFNAYCVSALMNQLKNHFSARKSHKNYPRVGCPVCGEEVYQIDGKHLKHLIDFDRYKRMYPKYPLSSADGNVSCPMSGDIVSKVDTEYVNRCNGTYTVADFYKEFANVLPKFPLRCPESKTILKSLSADYPSMLRADFTEKEFIETYPEFAGIIECPMTGKKMLEMTQEHLDKYFNHKGGKGRFSVAKYLKRFPNATLKAKQVPVLNPYTKKMVPELTLEMLKKAGTTLKDHLEDNASYCLGDWYPQLVVCPFTGRKTHRMMKEDLREIGRTVSDFYMAVCKHPLRKWQVQCAHCSKWVDNIWTHLETAKHTYAKSLTMEEFESAYGACSTRAVVSTNSFYKNDSGDTVHVADLFAKKTRVLDPMEVEDSLFKAAQDDLDRKIAKAIRNSQTLEDVCYEASERRFINLPFNFESGKSRIVRDAVKKQIGIDDFDFTDTPEDGVKKIEIMMPGVDTVKKRLMRMIDNSDLDFENNV